MIRLQSDKRTKDDRAAANDVISAPFREGLAPMLVVLLVAVPSAVVRSFRHKSIESIHALVRDSLFQKMVLVTVAVVGSGSFGYAYLGSRIGRRKPANIFGVILLLLLVAGVYWMTHAFD